MSGRKIEDHHFWAGSKSKGSVFPEGAHVKHEESDGHAGSLMHYEDTDSEIKSYQKKSESKVHGHPRKPGHRN
jgi:hypothetical protein